jgi:hypothetical protein
MAIVKRINESGLFSRSLILTHDLLVHLGIPVGKHKEAHVRIELLEGGLFITREGAPELSAEKKALQLAKAMQRRRESLSFRDGVRLNLVGPRLRLCELFWREGSLRGKDVMEKLNLSKPAAYTQIKRAKDEGLLIKKGTVYSLNPDYFDIQ